MDKKITLLLLLLLSSCSVNNLLKRSEKLRKLAIAKGAIVEVDTVYRIKYLPPKIATIYDTITVRKLFTDTLRVTTPEGIKVVEKFTLVHRNHTDTVYQRYIKVICPEDSIKEAMAVQTSIESPPDKGVKRWLVMLFSFLAFVLGFALRHIFK